MELFIQSYLSRHYEIKTSEVGHDGIYDKHDTRKHKAPVYGSKLTKELVTIFGVDEELVLEYINDWAASVKSDVDLEFYWATPESMFPIVERVTAQTIGLDIVSVQPMQAPTGNLFYLDFRYSGATPQLTPTETTQVVIDEPPKKRRYWNGRLE